MVIFVASSKRFYGELSKLAEHLKDNGMTVYHPYFHLDPNVVDADPELKSQVTLQHFPEIDKSEIIYALLTKGYIGYSVTIELAYAYAKGKTIIASELPNEFAVRPMISEVCSPEQLLARINYTTASGRGYEKGKD